MERRTDGRGTDGLEADGRETDGNGLDKDTLTCTAVESVLLSTKKELENKLIDMALLGDGVTGAIDVDMTSDAKTGELVERSYSMKKRVLTRARHECSIRLLCGSLLKRSRNFVFRRYCRRDCRLVDRIRRRNKQIRVWLYRID